MRKHKMLAAIAAAACLLTGSLTVSAADDRLGTIVDGSLLTDETSVEDTVYPYAKGTYLNNGVGALTIEGFRKVAISGRTNAHQVVDKINISLFLQRLEGNSWVPVHAYGPKSAYNAYTVSASKTYSITGGYYYRMVGGHSVVEDGNVESISSCTDGIWVE